MQSDLTAMRRARLFELLRQQNLSRQIDQRLKGAARQRQGGDEAALLRSLAMKSWAAPARPGP